MALESCWTTTSTSRWPTSSCEDRSSSARVIAQSPTSAHGLMGVVHNGRRPMHGLLEVDAVELTDALD